MEWDQTSSARNPIALRRFPDPAANKRKSMDTAADGVGDRFGDGRSSGNLSANLLRMLGWITTK